MARDKGRDNPGRNRKPKVLRREVFVFTEGEVTEPEFITFVTENGKRAESGREIVCTVENRSAPTKRRKPLPLVEEAIDKWVEVERAAKKAKLKPTDWNWPQVWCLFDRDEHEDIPTAFSRAKKAKVHVAYSHPCFELWRLLHYKDHTSSFGGVCESAAGLLRNQSAFPQTYGPTIQSVSKEQAKRVMPGQLKGKYDKARQFAKALSPEYTGPDQSRWDPYTDVWRFVEDGLDVVDY
ncbi:RloB family protein [Streptomyces kanamyceticus]|uniref:RloB domain-containing protein n=1 Tax=Streptomyces kanamyceticus TaxID=1967 RepID=A0A5J6GGR2_STRKN|nr:RloB family protein [Streptomyces kanamyceticus]QEU92356.1 RloB domain-containing protein [Streptomyces kanamyceticus]